MLQPDDLCTKAQVPVLEVLQWKHPELRDPPSLGEVGGAFDPYVLGCPAAVPIVVTEDVVETVATHLSGSVGPGGTDAIDLRNWLLRFGQASERLRFELASWTNWLANSNLFQLPMIV